MFIRSLSPEVNPADDTRWFLFVNDRLVLIRVEEQHVIPDTLLLDRLGIRPQQGLLLGLRDVQAHFAADLTHSHDHPEVRLVDLREAYGLLPEDDYAIANQAVQIAHWDRTTRFCPACATPTDSVPGERAKRCPACGFMQYPRVSPAIIVLIYRPGQVLLTRQPSWRSNMYSLVAGFVESGESLEACLRREILEEVGVTVDELRYLGSQPWPFPHQLMVGFVARYHSGEIVIDGQELEDARWFDLDALPDLPSPMSISRRIIDWHLATQDDPTTPFRGF